MIPLKAFRAPWLILIGDVRKRLRDLPDGYAHCVVTSPPYFALRDYGVDGQIGLEPSLDAYVHVLVEVFREVRRVLRDDGTVWVNLGDSYARSGGPGTQGTSGQRQGRRHTANGALKPSIPAGLKTKDLLMVPSRVALALQADGWYLRSEIVWQKRNSSPESVTDRPVSSHEKIYLLSKSERYFYDRHAVLEPMAESSKKRLSQKTLWEQTGGPKDDKTGNRSMRKTLENIARSELQGRNLRNVWTLSTRPSKIPHFAMFPVDIPLTAIKAGTSEGGCCAECGAPYIRKVETPKAPVAAGKRTSTRLEADAVNDCHTQALMDERKENPPRTTSWKPGCDHGIRTVGCRKAQDVPDSEHWKRRLLWRDMAKQPAPVTSGFAGTCDHAAAMTPAIVLDPFSGAATTGMAALSLGRRYVGVELNPAYAQLGADRLRQSQNEKPASLKYT